MFSVWNTSKLYSLAENTSTYYVVSAIAGTYLAVLILINLIPHLRVRSLGWFALCGVTVRLPDAIITASKIQLSFGSPFRSVKPFRIIHLRFTGVVVVKNGSSRGKSSHSKTQLPKNPSATEAISFFLPKLVSDTIFKRNWLNEFSVHLCQISFYHHEIDEDVSLHLAYVKIENTSVPETATTELTLSILDGYINDRSENSELAGLRLFHILEISVKSDLIFSCPPKASNKLKVDLFNFEILIVLTELRIRKLAQILEKKKKHASNGTEKRPLPSLQCFLAKLNMISSVQLKLEQSEIDFKELKLQSSSYSLNYNRDVSYKQQTTAKISTYVTAAKLSHLGSKCMEIPSITYILDIDLSDFYRAVKSDNKEDFTVDLFTTLSMTNPSFFVYFDQLAFLLDSFSAGGSHEKPERRKIPKHVLAYTKHIRKSSVKLIVVDLKTELHLPKVEREDFSRQSTENVISNAGAQVLAFKFSSKNLGNLLAKQCSSSTVALKSFLKLRNVFVEVEDNRIGLSALGAVIAYCLNTHKIALRISTKRLQLKSVNTMIFHVIRRVREAKISSVNRACANMSSEQTTKQNPEEASEELKREFLDLFAVLPPIIHSIKFRSTLFSSYIVCNDWLPSHVIHDEKLNEDIDLAHFKRGVSFLASGLELDYKRDEEVFEARLKQVQASTLSEYSSEYADDSAMKRTDPLEEIDVSDTTSMESGVSGCSSFDLEDNVETVKKVLNVEDIILRNPSGNRKKLILSIPEIEGRADMYLVWCIIYAFTLVEIISPRVDQTYTKEEAKKLKGRSTIVDLDVEIASLSVVTRLPHDVDILFEIDNLNLRKAAISPHCKVSYVRLYVVHPTTKLWSRLVSVTDIDVDFDLVSRNSIKLKSKSLRFNIPFQFLVYTVIDNVITFAKAIKQVGDNFKHLSSNIDDYSREEPVAREALKIPHIELKSDVMGITLENDAFESQLAIIYQYGAIENVERRRKLAAFEKKAEELRAHTRDTLSKASVESRRFLKRRTGKPKPNALVKALFNTSGSDHERSSRHTKKSNLREMFCGSEEEGDEETKTSRLREAFCGPDTKKRIETRSSSSADIENSTRASSHNASGETEATENTDEALTEDEAETLIAEAYDSLLEDISNSWVNKFQRYKRSYNASWKKRMENVWGPDTVNKVMRSKFDIQEYSQGPPQFQGAFTDLDFIVDDPKLDDVHEFLKKHGKGQPRLEYSILIPAYMRWRSSSVYMSLRDYALPFISFPNSGDPEAPVMDLKGTVVINEKLFSIPEELRNIFVPFSPATKASKIVDNFYSVKVIRTLTPVKVMFDLESTLTTDRSCVISWCKAYQPALSSAMMAFENFTKPEIDDSPIGWWDKMSLTAHGKINFFIKNELCLHMKSSVSPYALIGNSSGLVFCWKDNVSLRINDTGKRSELVILQSDDFILGIPNYSATEGKAWSLMNSNTGTDSSDDDGDAETNKFQKRVMKLTSDEKVTWKLGFLFERNVDVTAKELSADMERTDQFKPHYDVTVTGPSYEYHPDSYTEFRADYTHLAIGVNSSSKKGNSHNYAYFTPLTFEYFKVWWKTLNDNVSLPIREGKLFAKSAFKESSVKFGPHLFTLKYQIVLEPLTVSDVYLSSSGKDSNHKVVAYGAKGKADRCAIDLHQRREIARYVNEKLGINKKVRKLKMNLGEVEVSEADIRLLFAQFDDVSMMGKLLSFYSGETKRQVDLDTYEAEIKRHNARNRATQSGLVADERDYPWIDFDDFIEMEENDILSPNTTVKVIPFANTPRFTYFREFTLEHPEGPHPFGHEPSHECLIGANSPEEIQTQLVELRATEVKVKLNETIKKMKQLDPADASQKRKLEHDIVHWQKKAHSLETMRESASGQLTPNYQNLSVGNSKVASRNGSINEVKPQLSRTLSAYTAISSLDQAREIINEHSLLSKYHNRFLIHNLKMKWNNQVRDVFTSFLSVMGHRKTEELSMSRKALDLMDKLLKGSDQRRKQSQSEPSFVSENEFTCGNDVIEAFEEYLTSLDNDSEEIDYKYIVKFIKPQIHFQSDINPSACVLMTSKDIELRVFCVNHEGTDDVITESGEDASLLETRYGVLCTDSRVWAFQEDEFVGKSKGAHSGNHSPHDWTPWLNLEDGDDLKLHEKNLVFERATIAFSLKKPNMLAMENISDNPRKSEVVLHMAKLVISATSAQYCAFYYILTDLLVHGNQKNYFLQRIEQISSVSEASDFANLSEKVQLLQNNIRIAKFVILKMNEKSLKLSEQKRREYSHVKLELCRMKIELCIIIKSLEAKSSNFSGINAMSRTWTFNVDQLIFHILDDSRKPFVDLALATSTFTRLEEADGSNANSVAVSLIQGFNLREGIVYPEILQPYVDSKHEKNSDDAYDTSKPMISMNWKMLTPVGGIRVMKNAELSVQPLKIQLDYDTATDLFSFLFPKDEEKTPKHHGHSHSKGDDFSSDEYASENGYESSDSPVTLTSPSRTFKKIWNQRKSSHSDDSSTHTHFSSLDDSLSKDTSSVTSYGNTQSHETHRGKRKHTPKETAKDKISDDINVIMDRSAQYFVVGEFLVNKMKLCVSLKAPGYLNIIDVHNLVFSIPSIHYRDKTWTSHDFVEQLKKDVIKIFLSNTGKIIGNKFKIRNRKRMATPLRQISDFSSYVALEDLKEDSTSLISKTGASESEVVHRSNISRSSSRGASGPVSRSSIEVPRSGSYRTVSKGVLEDFDERDEKEVGELHGVKNEGKLRVSHEHGNGRETRRENQAKNGGEKPAGGL